jgi:hypothetical protein
MLGEPEIGRCWPCRAAHGFRITATEPRIDGKALTGKPPQWKMHDVVVWKLGSERSQNMVKATIARS